MFTQQACDINPYTFKTQKQHETDIEIHSTPILPDDTDEYGNLPHLRCGWKKCGKVFHSRDELMKHIKRCIPHNFVDRLHINCKNILTNNPDMSLEEFIQKVKQCYDTVPDINNIHTMHSHQSIHDNVLIAYYHKFQPLYKQHQIEKGNIHMTSIQKETAEILFNYKIMADKAKIEQNKHCGLPDTVDEYGNLPRLRCAWSKCGKVFHSRKELMEHVKECDFTYVDRFHTNCKLILTENPELTLSEFTDEVERCYDESVWQNIEQQIIDYYNHFRPLFMKHKAGILFNYRVDSQKKLIEDDNIPNEFTD